MDGWDRTDGSDSTESERANGEPVVADLPTVRALNDATRNLVAADTKADVAKVAAEAANEVLDFPGSSVRMYNEETHEFDPVTGGRPEEDDQGDRPSYPVEDSPHARAWKRGETVIDDIGDTDEYDRQMFEQAIYVPVGEYGTLNAGIKEGEFTELDVLFMEILAKNLRVALDQAEQRRELLALTETVEQLHRFSTELQSVTAPAEVYELAVDIAAEILGFDWCLVAVADAGWLEIAAVTDDSPVDVGERHLRVDEGLAGAAFQAGESKLTTDVDADDVSAPAHDVVAASVAVPLGEMGVFQADAAEPGQFDDRSVELAELLCAHVTGALERIQREQQLRERERELERQNERLDEFAGVVSHDLRNPLNLATGRLESARSVLSDEEVDDHLSEVDWALGRIDRLIDEVLTLARRGQAPEDIEAVSLVAAAEDAWASVDADAADLVAAGDPTVEADADRLVRLLENLFRNAVEHAGPAPRVEVGATDGGFYVADDGPGIPPDERDVVFESGFTTDPDGTGFGLAIVQALAEAHGWSVTPTESEHGGARFEFDGVAVLEA